MECIPLPCQWCQYRAPCRLRTSCILHLQRKGTEIFNRYAYTRTKRSCWYHIDNKIPRTKTWLKAVCWSLDQMYPPELEIKDTTESNTSASYLDLLLSIGRDDQLRISLYDKRDDFNFHITNFPFLSSNIPSSPAYGVFISQLIRYAGACSSYEYFILGDFSNKLLGKGTFEIVSKEVLWSVRGSYQTIWGPLSRMLHDILDDDHIQWHPPLIGHYTNFWPLLIWTLLPNLTFYLIVQGFHRTYAMGAARQQRTLTPPDTWSCLTLGLTCVLMAGPISPELVLSPDFWNSNIPRYFSFAYLDVYYPIIVMVEWLYAVLS